MKGTWPAKKLGDVCETGSGGTPLKARNEYYEGGTIPWLLSGEVAQGEVTSAANFITKEGLAGSSAKLFPENTVLVAMYGATAGQVGILRFEAATNQAVCGILPSKDFVPEFLFYLMLSKKDELVAKAAGNAQPNISQIKIRDTDVPIVPLGEQKRIVGILDEAFDGIATATTNAEKNLQNAQALLQSRLDAIFSQRGEVWLDRHQPLADLCEFIVDCEHKTAPTQDEGIPLIRTPNIGMGRLLLEDVYRVSEGTYKKWTRRAQPRKGDLILAREAPAGNVAVIVEDSPVCLGQRTVLIRAKRDVFDPDFLASLILQPTIRARLLAHSRGATVLHVNMKDIRALKVGPVPPLNEQQTIVSKISRVTEQTQRLESVYKEKFAALEELRKSLLHRVFNGGL